MKQYLNLLIFSTVGLISCAEERFCGTLDGGDLFTSITLNIVSDQSGSALPHAQAEYRVDGGELANCESNETGTLYCGVELAGEFEIHVWESDHLDTWLTRTVQQGPNHVEGHTEGVALESDEYEECCFYFGPDALYINVLLETANEIVPATEVSGTSSTNGRDAEDCEHSAPNGLACGWSSGMVTYTVLGPEGYEPVSGEIRVSHLEDSPCGYLDTQYFEVVLALSADEPVVP